MAPHKQGRETSLADADQTSSSRTEDIFLPSQPRACGPVTAAGPTRGRPHAVEEDVELMQPAWQDLFVFTSFTPHIGEGNGNPLQYSCLENPMDGGAW